MQQVLTQNSLKISLFISLFFLPKAFADEPVIVHYVDRPPYAISHDNSNPTGAVVNVAEKVFKAANIPFVWAKTPVNRQFAIVKENKGMNCILGVELTKSRLEFSKFTDPLYIGQPVVAIVNRKIKVKKGTNLDQMLAKHSILVKENYTLGDDITNKVLHSPMRYVTSIDSIHMVQMIARGRADFMMISNEEVEYYVEHGILDTKDINVIELPDVKIKFTRRLMCNKAMDDQLIAKLNEEIARLKIQPEVYKPIKNRH